MMPDAVVQVRREICAGANCPHQRKLNFRDPCAECPAGHWGIYSAQGCEHLFRWVPKRGRGDWIALFAQPIARMIDKLSGGRTHVATCGGCKQMQQRLNRGEGFWRSLWLRVTGR